MLKRLKDNDVVEHIFYHEWIAGENGTHGIHYYITRGRVSARKREKMQKKEITEITVELQMRKRKLQEKDIRKSKGIYCQPLEYLF